MKSSSYSRIETIRLFRAYLLLPTLQPHQNLHPQDLDPLPDQELHLLDLEPLLQDLDRHQLAQLLQ